MFNSGSGYSLADIAAATGRENDGVGFGDNGAWWIIILFLFAFCGWGNGNGFGGNNGSTTREEIAYGFDMNGLESSIRNIQNGLCDGFYAVNTGMLNGFSGVNSGITASTTAITAQLSNMAADQAACCCETKRIIEKDFADLNYNLATLSCQTRQAIADSSRDIIDNQNANTRSILDFLTQDKIAQLTAENQTLRFAASQQAQNAYLVDQLRPCPSPAYVVPNPYCNCGGYNSYTNLGCCGNLV